MKYLIYDDFSLPKKLYPYSESKISKTNRKAHALIHETLYEKDDVKVLSRNAISKLDKKRVKIDMPSVNEAHWRFDDGTNVEAKDVKSSIELAIIINAVSKEHFSSIQIDDNRDVIIEFSIPDVPVGWVKKQFEQVRVIPHKSVKEYLSDFKNNKIKSPMYYSSIKEYNINPIISGPFSFDTQDNVSTFFTVNNNYMYKNQSDKGLMGIKVYKQTMLISQVNDLVQNSNVNLIMDIPYTMLNTINNNSEFRVSEIPTYNVNKILFNFQSKENTSLISNQDFRKVIASAIDRQGIIVNKLMDKAELLKGPYWSGSPLNSGFETGIKFDPQLADNLINNVDGCSRIKDESGMFEVICEDIQVELTIIRKRGLSSAENNAISAIKFQLEKFGFKINDKSISKFNWRNVLKNNNWDLAYFTTHQDVSSDISLEYTSNSPYNYSSYDNLKLDQLCKGYNKCTSSSCERELAIKITNHLNEKTVSIFLWTLDYFYVINTDFLDYNTIDSWVNGYDFFTHPEKWQLTNRILE